MNYSNTGEQRPLLDSELPSSVFAERPWEGVSSKYNFVSTGEVVRALATVGVRPYLAKSSRTRIDSKRGYTKHMLRFRQDGAVPLAGEVYPELVIVNSHDTGSSFRVDLGLYRLICKNGLVSNYGIADSFRGRHVGIVIEDILAGVDRITKEFPRLADTVQRMQTKSLTEYQRECFAREAAILRWERDKVPFESSMLLVTRRYDDEAPTVWNVFNTIQENLLTGQRVRTFGPSFRGYRTRTVSTRAVGSIDVDMKLNSGLWKLATEYAGQA